MTTSKRTSKKKQASSDAGPTASRPHMPGYGVPKDKKGMLAWSHVVERMNNAMVYWVCTVSTDSRPHATPVDGLWLDGKLYFGGSLQTRRNRNLAANASVCVHLESGSDVVILQGEAHQLRSPDSSLISRLIEASTNKYGYGPKPEDFATGGTYVFSPNFALAWKQFPKDATRWHLSER